MSSEPKKVASNLQGLEWPFICLVFPGGFGWLRWVWNPTGEDGRLWARGNLHHSQPCLLWHTRGWARWGMTLHDDQSEVLGDIEELNCWFTYDQCFNIFHVYYYLRRHNTLTGPLFGELSTGNPVNILNFSCFHIFCCEFDMGADFDPDYWNGDEAERWMWLQHNKIFMHITYHQKRPLTTIADFTASHNLLHDLCCPCWWTF